MSISMAINWSIVEAIGTWFSGIITAGTLLFMYVQYHNERKERLKKEELDKDYEMLQETLLAIDKHNDCLYHLVLDIEVENKDKLDAVDECIKESAELFQGKVNEALEHIKYFKKRDLAKGEILETKLLSSSSYATFKYLRDTDCLLSRPMFNLMRKIHPK